MKVGICLPYMEKNFGRKQLLEWCKRIDDGPFSSLSCGERISGYTLEMRNVLAFAAAATQRVRIVPSLYVLPMHSAVWAAKEIATLDILSEGRVTATVGVGGREMDYQAVGASFEKRHSRMDQQILEMRRIWQGEPAIEGGDIIGPSPIQTSIPILAGVMGLKPMQRAAQWADGVYGFAMNGDKGLTEYFKNTAEQCWLAAGRTEKPYFAGGFWYSLADNAEQHLQEYVFQYLRTFGDDHAKKTARTMTRHNRDAVLEALFGMQDVGVDEVFMVPATAEIAEIERLESLLIKAGLV